jgi:hypothetical protein
MLIGAIQTARCVVPVGQGYPHPPPTNVQNTKICFSFFFRLNSVPSDRKQYSKMLGLEVTPLIILGGEGRRLSSRRDSRPLMYAIGLVVSPKFAVTSMWYTIVRTQQKCIEQNVSNLGPGYVCVVSSRSLRRADDSSRGILPSGVRLSVIVMPR